MSNSFIVQALVIRKTRSAHQDTNYIAVALRQNGQITGSMVQRVGDMNGGTHNVNLYAALPDRYGPADQFVFSFLVLNHSGSSEQNVTSACSKAMTQLQWNDYDSFRAAEVSAGGKTLPSCMSRPQGGAYMNSAWNEMKPLFANLDTGHCDGPVAIDSFSFTGASLSHVINYANHNQPYVFSYAGLDSSWGCGSNSDYSVQCFAGLG